MGAASPGTTVASRFGLTLRPFGVACGVCLTLGIGYWVATALGTSDDLLSAVFTLAMLVLTVLSWCAVVRAPRELKLFTRLASTAVTFALIGAVLWYIAYADNGHEVPKPPGYWSPFFWIGLSLGVAAAWAAVRDAVRLREAALDYLVVLAAAGAVAATVVDYQLEPGVSSAAVDATLRPLSGLLIVSIVVSAVLGRWRTLPLPVWLFALAYVFTAMGNLVFGLWSAGADYTDARWPDALWFTGITLGIVSAIAVILHVERPVRFSREPLPAVSPRAIAVVAVAAWSIAAATTIYGAVDGRIAVVYAGVIAGLVVAMATAMRTLASLRESRDAYRRLDETHFQLEQTVAERDEVIDALARRDVERRAVQTMMGALLDEADDRTDGELRARLEEAADDLAEWLPRRPG